MHPFNLPEISAILDDVEPELIKPTHCRQLGTREMAQWVQVQVVETITKKITKQEMLECAICRKRVASPRQQGIHAWLAAMPG